MCSIIGSREIERFKDLIELNQYRGSFSYSFAILDLEYMEVVHLVQEFGEFDLNILETIPRKDSFYYIGHVQAPTGGLLKDPERIHPSIIRSEDKLNTSYLWHNGILKPKCIDEWNNKLDMDEKWDTSLLHHFIHAQGLVELSEIDGSFGCVLIGKQVMDVFTTDTINLYIDKYLNLSSVQFDNSKRLAPNHIWRLNSYKFRFEIDGNFKSKSSPYYIP